MTVRDTVLHIERSGDRLLLATDFGAAIFTQGKLRRYFVDRAADCRLRVMEKLCVERRLTSCAGLATSIAASGSGPASFGARQR